MKLYTCFSQSHRCLVDRLAASAGGKFDLVVEEFPQECPSGEFRAQGWDLTMARKIKLWISACRSEREPFVFADADVQFFGPDPAGELLKMSAGFDLACQNDCNRLCAGLFVCRPSPEMAWFFGQVLACMSGYKDDQAAMNARWKECGVNAGKMSSRAFTLAMGMGWKVWRGDNSEIEVASIPSDIVTHHANWMVGVERKVYAMDRVKARVAAGLYAGSPLHV